MSMNSWSIALNYIGTKSIKIFILCFFNIGTACQMLPVDDGEHAKEERLIKTELAIIKNKLDDGDPHGAWDQIRNLNRNVVNHPDVLNMLGLTQLALKKPFNAIEAFKKAYKLKPKTSYALNLSSAYISKGNIDVARKLIIRALKLKDNYKYRERLWHNLALTYEKESKLNEAIKFYNKAINVNPNFLLSMLNLGQVYKRLNKEKLAMQMFQKTVEVCPNCFEAVHQLATSHINLGNYQNAVKILENFLRNSKNNGNNQKSAQKLLSMAKSFDSRQRMK